MYTDTKCLGPQKDWPQGRHQVWEASYCIVVEGLNSKTTGVKTTGSHGSHKKVNHEKGGGNGQGVMKAKNNEIYHLQKGRDAQERWSSACAGLCIHLPALRSSVDGALQTGHTAKGRWVKRVSLFSKKKTKVVFTLHGASDLLHVNCWPVTFSPYIQLCHVSIF